MPTKNTSDVVAVVVDYGTLGPSLAEKLAESYRKVYLYLPADDEFRNIKDCSKGYGIEGVERIEELFDAEIISESDLFIFPDIGWGNTQKYLRSIGKAVWGSMGADDFELYRTRFLDLLKKIDLPMVKSERIKGLTNLELYLKDKTNKWVKLNKFRGNCETFHWIDYTHGRLVLDGLREEFGGLQEAPVFVVQDPIETDMEYGYDGWTVDGQYPARSMFGFEKKNELYLGALREYEDLPEGIKEVNSKLSGVLKDFQYRNCIATEIREKDGKFYFIDPTMRFPGQTGEQLQETCENLADVIWRGANGEMIEPEFCCKFVVEGTIHYTAGDEDWRILTIPEKVRQWVKLYHYCISDDVYHFPPAKNDELGVVLGLGDTVEAAIEHLKQNLEMLKDEPIKVNTEGFLDLIESVKSAEAKGMKFSGGKLPEPEEILS